MFTLHKKQFITLFLITSITTVIYNYFTPPPIPDPIKEISLLKRTDNSFIENSNKLNTSTPLTHISDFIYASSVLESLIIKLIHTSSINPVDSVDISNYYNYLIFVTTQLKQYNPSTSFDKSQILLLQHNIVRLYSLIGNPQFIDMLNTYRVNKNNSEFQELVNKQESYKLWEKYFSTQFGNEPYLQTYIQDSTYLKYISDEKAQKIYSTIH